VQVVHEHDQRAVRGDRLQEPAAAPHQLGDGKLRRVEVDRGGDALDDGLSDKQYLLNRLQVESKKLQYKTRKMSDKNLDILILPHPLMGKMPVRELLMWTSYHVEHHTKQLIESY
jgi:hypothetical protein